MELTQIQRKEKGVAGMDIMKSVMTGILTIAILAFIIVLIASKMQDQTTNAQADLVFNDTINAVADNVSGNFGLWLFLGAMVVIVVLAFFIIRVTNGESGNTGGA